MKKAAFGIFTLLTVITFSLNAQESAEIALPEPTKGFYAGGQAATSGFGFNFRYIFNERLTLKTGVETLNFNQDFSFVENNISYRANADYKTGGIFLVGEYYYVRNLYFSAGLASNSLNPTIDGKAQSELEYGDIEIPAEEIGEFKFDLEPSLNISPYAGIGFRKLFGASKRVGYNFETGLYYLGAPKVNIEANGLLSPTADPAHGKKEQLEKQFQQYKFYPVVKMNIAVRLF
ncbi:MAG: hypothetical protein ACOC1J_01345 [Prolixibacteraceae bacterium]